MYKRIISLILIICCIVSVPAFADTGSAVEIGLGLGHSHKAENCVISKALTDCGVSRGNSTPTEQWSWSSGAYSAPFDIVQYTYTSFYFSTGDVIYYCIEGTSDANGECAVETYCKACGSRISRFDFYPSGTPYHRQITLNSHAGHSVYFKIIAYEGGAYWSDNDFTGTIKVGQSYV